MGSILIKNAIIITQDEKRNIVSGDILIEGNRISKVGVVNDSADTIIDADGKVAMPGFINTHAHVAMAHLKAMLDDITLDKFLEKTFKLDSERTEKGIYNSSLVGIAEMIDSGITSFHDLYYSEDVIAKAVRDSGIRGFLSWVTLDEEYTTQKGSPVKNAEKFISSVEKSDYIYPSVGVQGIYVASDETYNSCRDLADKMGCTIHTHLSETRKEVYEFASKHDGERPVEHLHKIGFLSEKLIAAHSSFVTMHEVRLLSKSGTNVSWNAISNCKLGTGGIPPIPEMQSNGITVSLGTDSNGSNNSLNMFEEMKFSSLIIKNSRWDPTLMPSQNILDMATVNAARSLGMKDLGSISSGFLADLILIDLKAPNLLPVSIENAVSKIVYSANPSNVDTVIINGKIVKQGHSMLKRIKVFGIEEMI
jgi:5-methylthioadenosine/S-adenosylhomocysteine deaminase